MKVILICGSPHKEGSTHTALSIVAGELENAGIETQEFWIGTDPVPGCNACGGCRKTGRCVRDDLVNDLVDLLDGADAMVIGSPTYYASPNGSVISLLDRLYYLATRKLHHKPCGIVTVARRGGTTATIDMLQKYPGIAQQPIVTSKYWNMVHGNNGQEVLSDEEGVQTLQMLGRNMAWMLKCIEAGRKAGIETPEMVDPWKWTNFIR